MEHLGVMKIQVFVKGVSGNTNVVLVPKVISYELHIKE